MHDAPIELPDIQRTQDHRKVPIDEVGVSDIRYPIVLPTKAGTLQNTVGRVAMTVGLDAHLKGTHMSRFMRVLNQSDGPDFPCQPWDAPTMPKQVLPKLIELLETRRAQVRTTFPYFLERRAPVTGLAGLNTYDCWIAAALSSETRMGETFYDYHIEAGVDVAIATLCPCSREISQYGAHNQRGHVRLAVGYKHDFDADQWEDYRRAPGIETLWFEDMIDLVERAASCILYPVLKRPDEKHVTEAAYDNPRFVEDVVRGVSDEMTQNLEGLPGGVYDWFHVRSVNHESIHQHNAVARVLVGQPSELIHDWI